MVKVPAVKGRAAFGQSCSVLTFTLLGSQAISNLDPAACSEFPTWLGRGGQEAGMRAEPAAA